MLNSNRLLAIDVDHGVRTLGHRRMEHAPVRLAKVSQSVLVVGVPGIGLAWSIAGLQHI